MRPHFAPLAALFALLFVLFHVPVVAAQETVTCQGYICAHFTSTPTIDSTSTGIAVGGASITNGAQGVAIGNLTRIDGAFGTALGTAIGDGAFINSLSGPLNDPFGAGTAIGQSAQVTGVGGIAIGHGAASGGYADIVIGSGAVSGDTSRNVSSLAQGNVVIGNRASAPFQAQNNVVLGRGASVGNATSNSVTLGASTSTNESNVVAIGSRRMTQVADATALQDATTLNQLMKPVASLGSGASFANGVYHAPTYALSTGTYNDVGSALTALDNKPGGVGGGVAWIASTEVSAATAKGVESAAMGSGSKAGNDANAFNLAVGTNATAGLTGSALDGSGGQATAIGAESAATKLGAVALGHGANAAAEFSVALGDGSIADEENTVSVGTAQNQRRIVNLADGVAPSDAMTMRQGAGIASIFGGGADFLTSQAPTYIFTSPGAAGTYTNVGTALDALDNGLNAVNQRVDTLPTTGGGTGEVGPQGPKGDTGATGATGPQGATGTGNGTDALAVHYDDATKAAATLGGAGGTIIHNLRAGVVDTDGANVGQVQQALAQAKSYADEGDARTLDWAKAYTDQQIRPLNRRINQAGAVGSVFGSMALSAGAIPQADKLSMGMAGYRGQSAIGIAYTHRFNNDRVAVAVGGAFAGDGSALGVSVSIGLGD